MKNSNPLVRYFSYSAVRGEPLPQTGVSHAPELQNHVLFFPELRKRDKFAVEICNSELPRFLCDFCHGPKVRRANFTLAESIVIVPVYGHLPLCYAPHHLTGPGLGRLEAGLFA